MSSGIMEARCRVITIYVKIHGLPIRELQPIYYYSQPNTIQNHTITKKSQYLPKQIFSSILYS